MLPPLSPLLMPMRMAAGAASVLEVVVALALLLGSVILVWKLAGRVYDQVLLRRGNPDHLAGRRRDAPLELTGGHGARQRSPREPDRVVGVAPRAVRTSIRAQVRGP